MNPNSVERVFDASVGFGIIAVADAAAMIERSRLTELTGPTQEAIQAALRKILSSGPFQVRSE